MWNGADVDFGFFYFVQNERQLKDRIVFWSVARVECVWRDFFKYVFNEEKSSWLFLIHLEQF